MAKEKESLRKELEKTKTRLKDVESKLKNAVQEKTKLEVLYNLFFLFLFFMLFDLDITCIYFADARARSHVQRENLRHFKARRQCLNVT